MSDYVVEAPQPLDGNAAWETGAIPPALRQAVLERDGQICRFCGSWVENPAIHHILYRSEGGLNVIENLVTVHWMYKPRCHERIHSQKRRWQPLLLEVTKRNGVSVLQLERWQRRGNRRRARA